MNKVVIGFTRVSVSIHEVVFAPKAKKFLHLFRNRLYVVGLHAETNIRL